MVKEGVVKVDFELLKRVEELVKRDKYKYASKKQVINLALVEFLKQNDVNIKDNKRGKK